MKKFVLLIPLLIGTALADVVTPAARSEINTLSLKYSGKVCRSNFEVDTDQHDSRLSAQQIREKRAEIYQDWKTDLEEDAKEEGYTYKIGYTNNQVWYWKKDRNRHSHFKIVSITATQEKELSCSHSY